MSPRVDVVIVGGGPAGLAAALVLGRARRRVVIIDAGSPRNARAPAVHGVLGHEGAWPDELLRIGRAQLAPYDVRIVDDVALAARAIEDGFEVRTQRDVFVGRKLLLATGVRDVRPDVPGVEACFGKTLFVCPYCDAWEVRDRRLAAWVPGHEVDFALALTSWSRDIVCFAASPVADAARDALARAGVRLVEAPVTELEHVHGHLVALHAGERVLRDAVFMHFGCEQASPLGASLGCTVRADGMLETGRGERADVAGVFVAGDASEGLQLVTIATAEGVRAACAIHAELRKEEIGAA